MLRFKVTVVYDTEDWCPRHLVGKARRNHERTVMSLSQSPLGRHNGRLLRVTGMDVGSCPLSGGEAKKAEQVTVSRRAQAWQLRELECRPVHQSVMGSIPVRACSGGQWINVSLSHQCFSSCPLILSLSLFLLLSPKSMGISSDED